MESLPFLAAGLLSVLLVILAILLLRRAEEDPLTARIDEFAAREEPTTIEDIELSMPITDRVIVPVLRRLGNLVTRFTPQSMLENTAHRLELAGSPGNISAAEFWVVRGLSTIGLGIVPEYSFRCVPNPPQNKTTFMRAHSCDCP